MFYSWKAVCWTRVGFSGKPLDAYFDSMQIKKKTHVNLITKGILIIVLYVAEQTRNKFIDNIDLHCMLEL